MESKKYFVGGNWKSNGTMQSTTDLLSTVVNKLEFNAARVEVLVAPTNLHLHHVKSQLKEGILLAA